MQLQGLGILGGTLLPKLMSRRTDTQICKLKKVRIIGFRSIEDEKIRFDGCGHKVLVGKNESGKSNILKALNLLSGGDWDSDDKKVLFDKNAQVRFYFDFDKIKIDRARKDFHKKFTNPEKTLLTEEMTVKDFFDQSLENVYARVTPTGKSWSFNHISNPLHGNWYLVEGVLPDTKTGKAPPVGSYINDEQINRIYHENNRESILQSLSQIKLHDINKKLYNIMAGKIVPNNHEYPVVIWRYDSEEHDLPPYVSLDIFSRNPDSCIPLKNIFLLAEYDAESIPKVIEEADPLDSETLYRFKSLLDQINEKVNKYIKENWNEYNATQIELRETGGNIAIEIKDSKNTYKFSQRSDGFRRFVSLLLSLNKKVYEDNRNPVLILIDEPETGLHPSSAKALRDHLINLGKNHLVVYATHSISMIDTDNIENNLVVTKENENTTIKPANEHGTSPAEMVYQAIGFSIYENLKKTNVLVEGYTDRKVLKQFLTGPKWKDIGICFTDGTRNIDNIRCILELGSREYFILSDADKSAIDKKKNRGNPEYWYTYKDLDSDAITIEDFYIKDFFVKICKEIFEKNSIDTTDIEKLPEIDRMNYIKKLRPVNNKIAADIKQECSERFEEKDINTEKIQPVLDTLLTKITTKPD